MMVLLSPGKPAEVWLDLTSKNVDVRIWPYTLIKQLSVLGNKEVFRELTQCENLLIYEDKSL